MKSTEKQTNVKTCKTCSNLFRPPKRPPYCGFGHQDPRNSIEKELECKDYEMYHPMDTETNDIWLLPLFIATIIMLIFSSVILYNMWPK